MKLTWHDEKRAIKDLVPYVANPRQITEKQAKDLKASLDKFGLADPIIINTDNTIIGGHQRKKILESLMGVAPDYMIDVRVPDRELSIDEMRELNVRLNKNMGAWDFDILANNFELDDLLDWGFEKSDLDDLDLWMPDPPEDAEPQIDRAEELREIWGVETGQLWQLGEHRLICGDCTDRAVVGRVMDIPLNLMVTDPPYGVDYDPAWRNEAAEKGLIAFAARREGKVENDDNANWSKAWELFEGNVVYCWHASLLAPIVLQSFEVNGFEVRSQIIWAKQNFAISRGHYHWKHETCFYFVRKGTSADWIGDHSQTTLWDVKWDKNVEGGHGTQKPVELMERSISNHNGDVYEPFSGSGSTLIACERLNRKCRAVEISPAYVAVAIQRWVDMTGGEPVLVE